MVVVAGAALTAFNRRKDGSSFRDWADAAFTAALETSTLERRDIDALVIASESDFFSLQLNPASVLADDLGLIGASTTRVEGGGASGQLAVHAGVNAILAGTARHVVIVGFDPSASALPPDTTKMLYGFSFDAWTDGMTGVSATALYALSIQGFMARTGLSENDLAAITIQNRANALLNPNAHLKLSNSVDEINASPMIASPYRRLHCSPLSDGAAALILSHPDAVPVARSKAPRIAGIGMSSDHVHLGARSETDRFTAKSRAMQRACAMADITPEDIGLAEVYDAYAGAQAQAIEALGLSSDVVVDLRNGLFAPDGTLPINLSGGLMGQGAPVGATGVGQVASCAHLLEGTYHTDLQLQKPPQYALADTHGGIATSAAVTVLSQGANA